mmetsp:Transcript_19152/g.44662  ORF Transcript_19152/g.44662 Transcript_19152/m.44662 type:complete len:203 (+) Transcript_19152:800-1408(+)
MLLGLKFIIALLQQTHECCRQDGAPATMDLNADGAVMILVLRQKPSNGGQQRGRTRVGRRIELRYHQRGAASGANAAARIVGLVRLLLLMMKGMTGIKVKISKVVVVGRQASTPLSHLPGQRIAAVLTNVIQTMRSMLLIKANHVTFIIIAARKKICVVVVVVVVAIHATSPRHIPSLVMMGRRKMVVGFVAGRTHRHFSSS